MPRDLIAYPETKVVDADGKILLRAAEIIEERGWRQLDYGLDGGPVCATGAILAAGGCNIAELNLRLGFTGGGMSRLSIWNDMPGRTKEQVIARLRACAVPS